MIRTERIASLGALTPWTADWNRLAGEVPFRRWEWLGAWWEQFGQGHELYVVAVFDDANQLIGLAPWYLEESLANGRVVQWLGSGNVCSDYLSLLAAPEHQQIVAGAVAEFLTQCDEADSADAWDLLKLEGIETGDAMLTQLIEALRTGGHAVHTRPGQNCWRVPLTGTWEQYEASISKPNRRKVRWAIKQFQDPQFSVRQITDPSELEPAWQMFVDLHQRRRVSIGEPGCFACEKFSRFLRAATERLMANGRARLLWIEKQGRPLAAELHLCDAQNTYAYQVGISPEDLHENPGWLVNTASLLATHQAGQTGFDLLRGDEPYKAHLGAEPRATEDLRIVSRGVKSQLRNTAWLAGDALRGWIKQGLELTGIAGRE